MYGVVLWSDRVENKAVIWCEDHGDLAYFCGSENSVFDDICLDAGDLVQFQVKDGKPMRRAWNPELVSEQHDPALAERLKGLGQGSGADAPVAQEATKPNAETANEPANSVGNVISFSRLCSA